MPDINDIQAAQSIKIMGSDSDGTEENPIGSKNDALKIALQGQDGFGQADVTFQSGAWRLNTTGLVQIEELFGQDPIPDVFFTILTAGNIGDTVRVQIAGTNNDSTTPDRDLPAVDYTYTLVSEDVGDERKLAENIADGLNADTNFANAHLDADVITGEKRATIHVSSEDFSLDGEFHERPFNGDFAVTPSGTTTIVINDNKIISRGKSTSLARDPQNPHRLGILGISGSVTVTPGSLSNRCVQRLKDSGGSEDMTVDGSVTPVEFSVPADPTGDCNAFIQKISIHGQDNGIKYGNFLAAPTLANGIEITIISEGETINLFNIYNTEDLKHEFTLGSVSDYSMELTPALDDVVATATFDPPFPLIGGSSDRITFKIQDNLSSVIQLDAFTVGFRKET